jgi:hypothetical protein
MNLAVYSDISGSIQYTNRAYITTNGGQYYKINAITQDLEIIGFDCLTAEQQS